MNRHEGTLNAYLVEEASLSYMLYDSKHVIFWKRQNYGDQKKKKSGCQYWGSGIDKWGTVNFQGDESTVQDVKVTDIGHYTSVQTHTMYKTKSPKVNSNGNYVNVGLSLLANVPL